jgi:HD superfamily phosphohydrolase
MLLKEQYTKDVWDKMKVEIIEKIKLDEMKYLKILSEEKMFEKMMKYYEESLYLESLRVYEKTLKNKFPDRLLKLYQKKCEEMVEYTNGRAHYQRITKYLKRMKKYPNGVDLVDQLIDQWILKYNRRSAMKEEFLKVKSKK